jgi:hypothetical protein
MKQVIKNYTINSSGPTITLTDFSTNPVVLERLYLITDVTTQTIIYQFNTTTGVSVSGNVITFSSLAGVSNSDKLQIIYDDQTGDPTYDTPSLALNAAKETGGNLATIATNTTGLVTNSTLTGGSQQTKITDGTNVANVLAPGTANSSGNAVLTAATTMTQTWSYQAITTGTSYDVGNYSTVSIHVATQYTTSTIAFQCSDDNTNWAALALTGTASTGSAAVSSTTTANVIYRGSIGARYFRINVTGTYSSGTCAGTLVFSTNSYAPQTMEVANTPLGAVSATGSITTSASSIVSASASNLSGFALVSIHGTYAGISFGITESDDGGTTYYSVPVYSTTTNQWLAPGATITPAANASAWYWVPVSNTTVIIKVLASAYTSGTGSIRIETGVTNIGPGSTMAQLMDAAGNNRGVNVNASNQLTVVDAATSSTSSAVPSSAVYSGGVARTSLPTAATAGNLTGVMTDKFGRLVALSNAQRDLVLPMTQLTLTASTTETTLITAVASTFFDIVSLVVINTSVTATQVDFRDSTGGTVRLSLYIPAGDTRGVALPVPMPQNAVNNNWTAKCATAVSSIIITGTYITNQ